MPMTIDWLNQVLLASYRWHQTLFVVGLGAMMVVDFFFLDGWATFWPTMAWCMIFGIHFMIFRSQMVDDEWARERLIFEVYRPWDTGHIEEIRNRPFGKSIYRTELGRVDRDKRSQKVDRAVSPDEQNGA